MLVLFLTPLKMLKRKHRYNEKARGGVKGDRNKKDKKEGSLQPKLVGVETVLISDDIAGSQRGKNDYMFSEEGEAIAVQPSKKRKTGVDGDDDEDNADDEKGKLSKSARKNLSKQQMRKYKKILLEK